LDLQLLAENLLLLGMVLWGYPFALGYACSFAPS
jgi:hypothetical protein